MSWEDQGRQYHGYFGHGTVPKPLEPGEKEDDRFGANGLVRRIVAVVGSLVAAAPRRERGWIERNHDLESRARLTYLMKAWIGGDALDQAQFSHLFFDRAPDSKLALNFRVAAHGAEYAKNSADLREAAERLAAAMQEVGAYHWLKFIRDATDAADSPKTAAEINLERKKADPRLDAARPTSAPDVLVGGVGTLLRKGVVAAGGALAGAMVRELLPRKPTPEPEAPATPATKPAVKPQAPPAKPLKVQQTQAEIDNAIREALNSTDPDVRLEGQVAQDLRNAGFQITGIRIEVGPNATITEIDIETPEAIIEVTNMSKGKLFQISRRIPVSQINPNGKPVILFAPNYKVTPERDIIRLGGYVVRTPKKLFARLLSLRGKQ